jgi:hypothetical protein
VAANPGRFHSGELNALNDIGFGPGNPSMGPPKPENDAEEFARQQEFLEQREGATKFSPLLTERPVVDTSRGTEQDARLQMQGGRQDRAEALGTGHAGPTVRTPSPRGRRRRYANTSDPTTEAVNRQIDGLMMGVDGVGGGQQQAMMAIQMRLAALQRRMSSQFGGMPPGNYSSMPENW